MKKIAIGNDHAGTQLKNQLKIFLEEYGYQLINFGTYGEQVLKEVEQKISKEDG